MMVALYTLHWIAGFIVVAEALNKLERTDLFAKCRGRYPMVWGFAMLVMPWRWALEQAILVFKVIGWMLLAVCAGYAVMRPLVHVRLPDPEDTAGLVGIACLVIRARLLELYLARRHGIPPSEAHRAEEVVVISASAPLGDD